MEADARHHGPGDSPNPMSYGGTPGLERTGRAAWLPDEAGHTSVEGVFAGGDAAHRRRHCHPGHGGPGKHAAKAIDEYLKSKK